MKRAVSEGSSLAHALGEHPKVFSTLYVNMVAAGESSGNLDVVFERLAEFTENQVRLRANRLQKQLDLQKHLRCSVRSNLYLEQRER